MDTILLPRTKVEKIATSVSGIAIAISLIVLQTSLISAKDLGIGSYTGLSPTLNNLIQEQSEKEKSLATARLPKVVR